MSWYPSQVTQLSIIILPVWHFDTGRNPRIKPKNHRIIRMIHNMIIGIEIREKMFFILVKINKLKFLHPLHNFSRFLEAMSNECTNTSTLIQSFDPHFLLVRDFWSVEASLFPACFFKLDEKQASSLQDYTIIGKALWYAFERVFSPYIVEFCESFVRWVMECVVIFP